VNVHALAAGNATAKRGWSYTVGTDTLAGIETIVGTLGPDTFYGSTDADHFIGDDGNGWFLPWGGDDVIEGGAG
jgi:Ca2+-binding RTX toxin-like protein